MNMVRRLGGPARLGLLACLLSGVVHPAADAGKQLLEAAAQGRDSNVQDLLGKGAPLESKDKNGRTALMLASQRGHVATVRILLDRGADPYARDEGGATAWVLARFSPTGNRGGNEEALKLLPRPTPPKVVVEAGWSAANLYNSCIMRLDQLTQFMNQLQPDLLALSEFRQYFNNSGKDLIEVSAFRARGVGGVEDESFAGADAVLILNVRPGVTCVQQQSADHLTLSLEVQLLRASDRSVLLRKVIGASRLEALHARLVTGQAQYFPVYEEWVKPYAEQGFWAAVEAWYRAE
jgi:hypothetical protein